MNPIKKSISDKRKIIRLLKRIDDDQQIIVRIMRMLERIKLHYPYIFSECITREELHELSKFMK